MKKTSIILLIISVITLIIMFFIEFTWLNDGSRRSSFIIGWLQVILLPLVIPLLGKSISIALVWTKTRV